ncbi:hypothetical protein Bhyg_17885, partial [Pseudolycoriella hygida]
TNRSVKRDVDVLICVIKSKLEKKFHHQILVQHHTFENGNRIIIEIIDVQCPPNLIMLKS